MFHPKMDDPTPVSSSPAEVEAAESIDEPSANCVNTTVDDVSEGYSNLKKIAVF